MKQICIGILAHVDAGKTTLSEALLYRAGAIRRLGRVDHQDAFLDTDAMERQRGITIFSKQAILPLPEKTITLLDTPGHVDFSAEAERTLRALDYAILVVGANDGVQGHTETLWRLLARYDIPTFIFINKIDLENPGRDVLLAQLGQRLSEGCLDANELLTAAGKPELVYYNASATDKYLVDQNGKWSAQAANDYMATILPEYSEANGNMVELIICNNDGMAEGAVSALQGAGYNTGDGKTIPVFGVDATDSAKQLINEGKMTGTIKQDAEGMASTILNLVSSVQGGGELMDNTSSFNVDEGVAKIRVPYATYTGE